MIKEAMLYEKLNNNAVRCGLCAHRCAISDSKFGFCGVRQNKGGVLYTHTYSEIIAYHVDPIEKKPFYHFLPGSGSFSVAAPGCNFRCIFCQNWQISQITMEDGLDHGSCRFSPEETVKEAKRSGCKSIAYTYTEPTIFFEYAYDTAKLAKKEGLYNVFVTNGYMTEEALKTIHPFLDACNVDLKFFSDESYKKICRGALSPVLNSIRLMKKLNMWVEVTTLIVPGLNDSEDEIKNIADFIAGVDVNIPWHISRFHPDYQYADCAPTSLEVIKKAYDIGKLAGLRYVYIGNVDNMGNDTVCYSCGRKLIKRRLYFIQENSVTDGKCLKCNSKIDGVWN
ncbi:MAG: AmmeMemoRadiSam system radical SAM enzyme [Candidatus Omnitrophica bacterium]|nr:AmmeMemoRadiSam system radical SAM enzyme [Candidatus Omnitrophota bacterium]